MKELNIHGGRIVYGYTEKMQKLKTKSKLTRTNTRTQRSLRFKQIGTTAFKEKEKLLIFFFLRIRNQPFWRPSTEIKLWYILRNAILLHTRTTPHSCTSNKVMNVQRMIVWCFSYDRYKHYSTTVSARKAAHFRYFSTTHKLRRFVAYRRLYQELSRKKAIK